MFLVRNVVPIDTIACNTSNEITLKSLIQYSLFAQFTEPRTQLSFFEKLFDVLKGKFSMKYDYVSDAKAIAINLKFFIGIGYICQKYDQWIFVPDEF